MPRRDISREEFLAEFKGKRGVAYTLVPVGPGWSIREVRFEENRVTEIVDREPDLKPLALSNVFSELEKAAGL